MRILASGLLSVVLVSSCGAEKTGGSGAVPCAGAGTICTWAGTGEPAFTGDGDAPLQTALYWPMDVEFAPNNGPGYVLDWQNHRVRRVDATAVTTVIGTDEPGDGPVYGMGDETKAPGVLGTSISLNHPTDIQFAPDGTMFLAAWHNHKVRKLDVSTDQALVACGRGPGYAGDKGPEGAALLNMPKAIALSPSSGDLYIADTRNFRVRRVAGDTGVIDTVVGTGMRGAAGDGGPALAAGLSFQLGLDQGSDAGDNPEPGGALALDAQGRLYIADTENQRIRRVDFVTGLIETVAGNGVAGFAGDGGPAIAASLSHPRDIEIGPGGRLFIADTDNQRIRVVDLTTGIITTVAGNGTGGFGGDGGAATEAALWRPFGVAFDAAGDLYISDTFNNRVRRVVQP